MKRPLLTLSCLLSMFTTSAHCHSWQNVNFTEESLSDEHVLENIYRRATCPMTGEAERVHLLVLLYHTAVQMRSDLYKDSAEHELYYHVTVFSAAREEYLTHYKGLFSWSL